MTTANSSAAFVARALALDCAALSDALDRSGVAGQCYQIQACDRKFRMAGHAYTVLYRPAYHGEEGHVGDYIDDIEPGSVVVIDNRGHDHMTTWGNILTEMAHQRKLAGTVIDGINRDVALCSELNYPIYSRGSWMRTGKDRGQVQATGIPVNIGEARVAPGDSIKGDTDGVVVIPKEHEDEVLQVAEEIEAAENQIRAAARSGIRLDEARKQFKYHQLQTRSEK